MSRTVPLGPVQIAFSVALAAVLILPGAALAENVHFTYLWHLEQPVYWPAQQAGGADRYQRAWESIQLTDGGAAHPADNLRDIFGLADRVAAYQSRPRDTVNAIRNKPEAGAQVSYSGGLIENIASLGTANQLGYSPGWFNPFREARNWTTSTGGKPRMDIVLFAFHHPLLPLCDDSTVRREIQLYKAIYPDAWGGSPGLSRGLFPSEMAFSERLIPALVAENVAWVVVSNEHLSRACSNFPLVLGSGGVNCEPPNAADKLNPSQSNWLRTSISRGCAPCNAYPFAYTPHYARYVDPATGAESKLVVVPADQALSWQDGYSPIGLDGLNTLQTQNPSARPQLVLMAHDGDNAWGGGFSYYMEAVPNFVNSASSAGYVPTTVEKYLADHPVPTNDVVKVEDGAWVNADGDFGSPTFLNWNWPLLSSGGQIDVANGWHVDERNWAVITAAQNRLDTAEQIAGGVNIQKILYPDGSTTNTERAWHYFLAGLNSGFMYYGTPQDHEVKATVACNKAVQHADLVIGGGSADATPPTVWIPQRFPWNPGSLNFGPQHGYQQVQSNGDFWVWTFAYDVSGLSSVTLKHRLDDDAAMGEANLTYAGGPGVAAWQSAAMTQRAFPTGNVYADPSINFFVLPTYIAAEYSVQLTGVRDKLVDYYVEATDTKGYVKRSPIQHVYVGTGSGAGGGGGGERVEIQPDPLLAGESCVVRYNAAGGPLAGAGTIKVHVGFNNWQIVQPTDQTMTYSPAIGKWEIYTLTIDQAAFQMDVAFNDGAGTWDNNGGQDWHAPVVGGFVPWTMDGARDSGARLVAQNNGVQLYAGVKNNVLYVAAPDAGEGNDHFIYVAAAPGALRTAQWAKAGQVADWSAFLADENNNDFEGWFDQGAGVSVAAATGANGGWIEGTINLEQELGALPEAVYLAFAAFPTNDGSALLSASQVPASVNANGNVDASEYIRFETFLRGDLTGDFAVTILDVSPFVDVVLGFDSDPLHIRNADLNANGAADADDVQAFVARLVTGA